MNGEASGQIAEISSDKKKTKRKNSNGHGIPPNDSPELAVILQTLVNVRNGDFSVRLPVVWDGLTGRIAETFNEIVSANQQMALELKRLGQSLGKEGKIRERVHGERWKGRSIRSPKTYSAPSRKLLARSLPSPKET